MWSLGLTGLLPQFQDSLGSGFSAVYHHAKGCMDFGTPEFQDVLLAACSGLCLASITALAFAVLTHLQPVSPAEVIVRQQRGSLGASIANGNSSSSSSIKHIDNFGHSMKAMRHTDAGCVP